MVSRTIWRASGSLREHPLLESGGKRPLPDAVKRLASGTHRGTEP
jgi:hypothetical protein